MYQIYADGVLIYDDTAEINRILKGNIEPEVNKSGSFVFTVVPGHDFYDVFVNYKTVIVVYKSGKIKFRGRVLSQVINYRKEKTITCEGELGFFNDSIIRPFEFGGTPENFFIQIVTAHNNQVDDFKKFKIGTVTVTDTNDYIVRSAEGYNTSMSILNSRLLEDATGGYLFITHGSDGTEEIPTIHYLKELTGECSQTVEFGANLLDYTKTLKGDTFATALIPLGARLENDDPDAPEQRLTIESVNGGSDYIYNQAAVDQFGRITIVEIYDDITVPENLLRKAELRLVDLIGETVTIELNAVDMHLLDRNIESFEIGDLIRVTSQPHGIDRVMLCSRQSIDILNPANDKLVLGDTLKKYTQSTTKTIESLGRDLNAQIKTTFSGIQKTAKGLYETLVEDQETGGTIVYFHDKPNLDESGVILRVSTVGVEGSPDAGNTWYGIQVDGTFIAKLLETVGINADWINAGSISVERISLYGDMTVYTDESLEVSGGKFGYGIGQNQWGNETKGIHLVSRNNLSEVIATTEGARISHYGGGNINATGNGTQAFTGGSYQTTTAEEAAMSYRDSSGNIIGKVHVNEFGGDIEHGVLIAGVDVNQDRAFLLYEEKTGIYAYKSSAEISTIGYVSIEGEGNTTMQSSKNRAKIIGHTGAELRSDPSVGSTEIAGGSVQIDSQKESTVLNTKKSIVAQYMGADRIQVDSSGARIKYGDGTKAEVSSSGLILNSSGPISMGGGSAIWGQVNGTSKISIDAASMYIGYDLRTNNNLGTYFYAGKRSSDGVESAKMVSGANNMWVKYGGSSPQGGSGSGCGWTSDRRMKHDIKYDVDGDLVDLLKPASFKMIGDEWTTYGFIAQDVLEVIPNLITESPEEEGVEPHLGLNYLGIIPFLTAKIQTQNAAIKSQRQQINDLEKRIVRLEDLLNE